MMEAFKESLNDIRTRLRLLFTRGRVVFVYPPAGNQIQTIQATGLAGETLDQVEHAEPYGHAASPLPGAEPFLAAVLGQRNQLAALVINDPRGRPEGLEPGEVIVWSAHGQKILLRADGGITISAPGKIDVAAPSVKVTAENVSINSPAVGVGKGTRKRVARIGDRVRVGSGSSAGLWPIVEGAEHMEAS